MARSREACGKNKEFGGSKRWQERIIGENIIKAYFTKYMRL